MISSAAPPPPWFPPLDSPFRGAPSAPRRRDEAAAPLRLSAGQAPSPIRRNRAATPPRSCRIAPPIDRLRHERWEPHLRKGPHEGEHDNSYQGEDEAAPGRDPLS